MRCIFKDNNHDFCLFIYAFYFIRTIYLNIKSKLIANNSQRLLRKTAIDPKRIHQSRVRITRGHLCFAIGVRLRAPEAGHLNFRLGVAGAVVLEVLGNLVLAGGGGARTERLAARQHAACTQAGYILVDRRRAQRFLGLTRSCCWAGGLLAAERANSKVAGTDQTRGNGEHICVRSGCFIEDLMR